MQRDDANRALDTSTHNRSQACTRPLSPGRARAHGPVHSCESWRPPASVHVHVVMSRTLFCLRWNTATGGVELHYTYVNKSQPLVLTRDSD